MPRDCVFDCRHPLWGGDGVCVYDDDATADAVCLCDAGFVSRNTIGYPSCVPERTLVTCYLVVAAAGGAITLFLLWHATQYLRLPSSTRSTRKVVLRLGVILSGR